jgi:hypothetical protein
MHDGDNADSSVAAGVLVPVDPSGPGRGVIWHCRPRSGRSSPAPITPHVATVNGAPHSVPEELTIDPEHFEPNTSHDARPPLLADEVALVTGAIAASAPKSRTGSPHAGAAVALAARDENARTVTEPRKGSRK